MTAALGWMLGIALGMRHALEPDHVAVVSTMIADRPEPGRAARTGAWWGGGHALALFIVGVPFLLLSADVPPGLDDFFELTVALVLLGLGAKSIVRALRPHRAGTHRPDGTGRGARAPLLAGLIHGFAGSGALVLMATTMMPSTASGVLFMALFGLGSIVGMALTAAAMGYAAKRFVRAAVLRTAGVASLGLFSMGLGLWWGAPIVYRLVA